jgi:hypothetical protein
MDTEKQTLVENYEQRIHIAQANIQMLASELDEQQEMATNKSDEPGGREITSAKSRNNSFMEKGRGSVKQESQISQPTRQISEPLKRANVAIKAANEFKSGIKEEPAKYVMSKREKPVEKASETKRPAKLIPKRELKQKETSDSRSWRRKSQSKNSLRKLHVRIIF